MSEHRYLCRGRHRMRPYSCVAAQNIAQNTALDIAGHTCPNADTMANHYLDTEISSRISAFLDELSALVKRQALEAVHEALGGAVAPPRRGPGRPRRMTVRPGRRPRAMAKRAVKGKRVRRSPEDLAKLQSSILAAVRAKQGQRLEEIGRAMRTDTGVLKRPMALLLAAKKLKTQGKKRGTKYFSK